MPRSIPHGFAASAAAAFALLAATAAQPLEAKTPGSTYCFNGICHRVLTLEETRKAIGVPQHLIASHYDIPSRDRYNPSLVTSSGEIFRADTPDNAASPLLPDGTQIAVYVPATKRGAIVRINNSGPYFSNRKLDLSRALADKLGFGNRGISRVVVEVLAPPTPRETRYSYGRRYGTVPGYLGRVGGIEAVREHWYVCGGSVRFPECGISQQAATGSVLPSAAMIATGSVVPRPENKLQAAAVAQKTEAAVPLIEEVRAIVAGAVVAGPGEAPEAAVGANAVLWLPAAQQPSRLGVTPDRKVTPAGR